MFVIYLSADRLLVRSPEKLIYNDKALALFLTGNVLLSEDIVVGVGERCVLGLTGLGLTELFPGWN